MERNPSPLLLNTLQEASAIYGHAAKTAESLRGRQNELIHRALAEGATHAQVAKASGLSRGRVSQFVDSPSQP